MEEIIEKIIARFVPGDLITHDYLKGLFSLSEPEIGDFETTREFIVELQNIQFKYMTLVDKLRDDLLHSERYYLKNVRGDGYTLLKPSEQVSFAYDEALSDIKKAIRQATNIMTFIRHDEIPFEQSASDNDKLTRMSNFAQMFANRRK